MEEGGQQKKRHNSVSLLMCSKLQCGCETTVGGGCIRNSSQVLTPFQGDISCKIVDTYYYWRMPCKNSICRSISVSFWDIRGGEGLTGGTYHAPKVSS